MNQISENIAYYVISENYLKKIRSMPLDPTSSFESQAMPLEPTRTFEFRSVFDSDQYPIAQNFTRLSDDNPFHYRVAVLENGEKTEYNFFPSPSPSRRITNRPKTSFFKLITLEPVINDVTIHGAKSKFVALSQKNFFEFSDLGIEKILYG